MVMNMKYKQLQPVRVISFDREGRYKDRIFTGHVENGRYSGKGTYLGVLVEVRDDFDEYKEAEYVHETDSYQMRVKVVKIGKDGKWYINLDGRVYLSDEKVESIKEEMGL